MHKIMSEYDHSAFLNQPRVEEYLEALDGKQKQALVKFYSTYGDLDPDADRSPNTIRNRFPRAQYAKTQNHIFVALRHTAISEMAATPDDYHLSTCRELWSGRMFRETYAVKEILSVRQPHLNRMDRVIYAESKRTHRHAVMQLGHSAMWIELNDQGYPAYYPLTEFRPSALLHSQFVEKKSSDQEK